MDLVILAGVLMLVVWAVATFVLTVASGWTNALLTFGVALIIWRMVAKATPKPDVSPPPKKR